MENKIHDAKAKILMFSKTEHPVLAALRKLREAHEAFDRSVKEWVEKWEKN